MSHRTLILLTLTACAAELILLFLLMGCAVAVKQAAALPLPPPPKRAAKTAVAASPKVLSLKKSTTSALILTSVFVDPQVHRENIVILNTETGEVSQQQGMVISFTNGPGAWRIDRSVDLSNWTWAASVEFPWLMDLSADPMAFFRLTPSNGQYTNAP